MKLLNWIIKMAKKILNLDTENGIESWGDMPTIPSGTATVGKLFYFGGTLLGYSKTIYNTDLGLDANFSFTANSAVFAFYYESMDGSGEYYPSTTQVPITVYANRVVLTSPQPNRRFIATVAINTEAIAEVTGGGSLPEGTVNQTLRHNGTEWESTDRVKVGVSNYDPDYKEIFMRANEFGIWNGDLTIKSVTFFVFDGETASTALSLCLDQNTSQSNINLGVNRQEDGSELSSIDLVSYDAATSPYASQHVFRVSYSQENSCYELETFGNTPLSICKFSAKTIQSDYLAGTGDRPIVADSTGKLKVGTAISGNTPLEYLSANLTGTEHTFNNATLGITGDLRTRIKFIDVYAVDVDGNWNSDLIDSKFVYENDITINSTVSLGGSFKIRLYIEYV